MLNKGMEQILGVTLCMTICGCLGFKMFKSVHDHMWVCGYPVWMAFTRDEQCWFSASL